MSIWQVGDVNLADFDCFNQHVGLSMHSAGTATNCCLRIPSCVDWRAVANESRQPYGMKPPKITF